MESIPRLIEQLEACRQAFMGRKCALERREEILLKGHMKILEPGLATSKSTQMRWNDGRRVLKSIFLQFGCDVFLLCTISSSHTALLKLNSANLIDSLSSWWQNKEHPPALHKVAQKISDTYSLTSVLGEGLEIRGTVSRREESDQNPLGNMPATITSLDGNAKQPNLSKFC